MLKDMVITSLDYLKVSVSGLRNKSHGTIQAQTFISMVSTLSKESLNRKLMLIQFTGQRAITLRRSTLLPLSLKNTEQTFQE